MLRARKRGVFRSEYDVESDGGPVTTLAGQRREGCVYTVDGAGYRVERDGRKRFLLHGPGGRTASAERVTSREWTVRAQTGNVKLVKPSMWRSMWEVHQRGSARGTVRHEGMFSRTYVADLPSDLPMPVRLFALYVVLVSYEREAATIAATSGS